jgi:hypothetical protein
MKQKRKKVSVKCRGIFQNGRRGGSCGNFRDDAVKCMISFRYGSRVSFVTLLCRKMIVSFCLFEDIPCNFCCFYIKLIRYRGDNVGPSVYIRFLLIILVWHFMPLLISLAQGQLYLLPTTGVRFRQSWRHSASWSIGTSHCHLCGTFRNYY